MKQLKVVIAGDAALIKGRLQWALTGIPNCVVVGTAVDETAAVVMVRTLRPDVVILDMRMPHKNGIGVLKEIRNASSTAIIVIFTADDSVVLRDACLDAGANYYLSPFQMTKLVDICRELLGETVE